jgi:hypothetical protein
VNESQVYLEQLTTLSNELKTEITGTDANLMYQRPAPSVNTPGFLYWHILRIWDLDLNHFIKAQPDDGDAWYRGGFTDKAGYDPSAHGPGRLPGMGFGYTDEEVDEIAVIPVEVLIAYHDQLMAETVELLNSDIDLRAEFTPPGRSPMTAAARLQHLIGHSYGHLGDIRFAKGLQEKAGLS